MRACLTHVSYQLTSEFIFADCYCSSIRRKPNFLIKSFQSRALADLWHKGWSSRIDQRLQKRILLWLDRLEQAGVPEEMNLPGFNFHALRGYAPTRYSVHVNGPWCLTFEFESGDAHRVDFEQYH